MTTFGLPRHVVTFLRHMEPYKEFLKWDLCEGSHKITLRLSWNFRKHSGRESLWHKLQRTMKLSQSQDSSIPQDLSRFLENSPKKSTPKSSSFSRPLSWARISSISLPSRWRHNHSASASPRNSFRGSSSMHGSFHAHGGSPSRLSLPVSPSRYSWPGTGNTSLADHDPAEPSNSTPVTSTPDTVRSEGSPYRGAKVRITYRMEEDIARSLESIAEKVHEQNKQQLGVIQREWNDAIRNWQRVLLEEEGAATTSFERLTDSEPDLQQVNQTVQRCLETCDSILDKHSTLIL